MEPWLIWLLGGLVLLGAELLLPGIFLIWVGLAALGTGVLVWLVNPAFALVVLAFLLQLGAGIAMGVAMARERARSPRSPNAPGAGLVGRQGTVLGAEAGALRVRLGDSDWPARWAAGEGGAAPGEPIRVEAVEGLHLVVTPLR